MSPTAGIKPGMKGCSLCSISIVLGVYLEKTTPAARGLGPVLHESPQRLVQKGAAEALLLTS